MDHRRSAGDSRPALGRRELIGGLTAMAAARPVVARAQPERLRRIGVLYHLPENAPFANPQLTTFAPALGRLGWVEGRNIRIDYRFAAVDPARFKAYAAELVGLSPDAILAFTPPAVVALKQQAQTIPIVFVFVVDPVALGFVQSIARPGGNITGFTVSDPPLMGKWLQLLKEMAPRITRIAVIFNPDTAPHAPLYNRAIEAAAPSLGMTVTLAPVHDDAAIEESIAALAREPDGGLLVIPEPFPLAHRDVIIAAALRHGLPLIGVDLLTRAGGLMSYFFDPVDLFAQAASYIDRILKGASPADLPVQEPTRYSLIVNLKKPRRSASRCRNRSSPAPTR
jgi:putative tryptophan/tyrosine transport system substrate-binding protein